MKLGLISLGCAKNRIDSELFLGVAKQYNIELTSSLSDADIIVINTCGFIETAKQEGSIQGDYNEQRIYKIPYKM